MDIDKKKSFFEDCNLHMSDEEIDVWCRAIKEQFEEHFEIDENEEGKK